MLLLYILFSLFFIIQAEGRKQIRLPGDLIDNLLLGFPGVRIEVVRGFWVVRVLWDFWGFWGDWDFWVFWGDWDFWDDWGDWGISW